MIMRSSLVRILIILLILEAAAIGAYMIWGVNRTGNLMLKSTPSGARVLLNLESTTYLTDTLITDLPEGKYSVTLEMKGYVAEPFVQVVHVLRNQLSAVHFDLEPAPQKAEVIPPPEPVQPEAEKPREEYKPSIPIPESQMTRRETTRDTPSAPLPTQETPTEFGSLDVASNIFGADIYMDGKNTGQITNATLLVPVGTHRFSVAKDNYKVQPEEIVVDIRASDVDKFILFELIQDLESLPYRLKVVTKPVAGGILIDKVYRGDGMVAMDLDPGEYMVSFEPVTGYETPRAQKVTLNPNQRSRTVTATYERLLDLSVFIDHQGHVQRTGEIQIDRGYYFPDEGAVTDTMWGPAIKYVKELSSFCWEIGWGIATKNPTGQDYLRFRFTLPDGFSPTRPIYMKLHIYRSAKNYPLTVLNRSEMDVLVNGTAVLSNFTPEHFVRDGLSDAIPDQKLNPYLKDGTNEIIVKSSDSNQTFLYCRGIEIH
jgi:hypothetical protein